MMHRPGFTLVEQIISLLLIMGVMAVMAQIFIDSARFAQNEGSRIQVGETAARAMATLDDTLREGRAVATTGTVNSTLYTTDDSTLVLMLPSLVNGALTSTNDVVVIRRNSNTNSLEQLLAPYVNAGNPALNSARTAGTTQLATDVGDVYFRYTTDAPIDSTAVTVVVTSSSTIQQRAFARTTLVYETLRNHP